MKKIKWIIILILIISSVSAYSKDIKGYVENVDLNTNKIIVNANNKLFELTVNSQTKIQRYLIGTPAIDVDLSLVSPGDAANCSYNDNNVLLNGVFTFKMIKSKIISLNGNTLTAENNQIYNISKNVVVKTDKDKYITLNEVKNGEDCIAKINPVTGDIWLLIYFKPDTVTQTKPEQKPVKPINVNVPDKNNEEDNKTIDTTEQNININEKTDSVIIPPAENNGNNYFKSAEVNIPDDPKSGDYILIHVLGENHCGVSADIQYVKNTKNILKEINPGEYAGCIMIPEKNLNKAKIMVYMSKGQDNISAFTDTVITVKNKKAELNKMTVTQNVAIRTVSVPENSSEPKNEEPKIDNNTPEETVNNSEITDAAGNNDYPEIKENTEKAVEKKESEQINSSKEVNDQNTNIDSITDPLKDNSLIKIEDIKIVTPQDGALIKDILVSGIAIPNESLSVKTYYTNEKNGVLSIKGILNEDIIKVNEEGIFNYGPIEIKNFLATSGLVYLIQIGYENDNNGKTKIIRVVRE